VDFQLFLKRFSGALEAVGFGSELSHAIAAALGEMADNIVQHANQPSRAHGIVAYETNERSMIFVVVDVGQGILRSLRQLSKWQHLQSHKEALFAAVCEGATSRIGAVQGTGFKQVHRALASHNGVLRFRTGDTVLTLTGASDPKTAIAARVAPMGGFQICVSCNL
jgi:hypothetical protein